MLESQQHWFSHGTLPHQWALVLAAGEGSRLQALTTTASGIAVPKQFCSLGGGSSLLHDALQRACVVVPAHRICAVVAKHQERWWRPLSQTIPSENIIVQPRNRGTGIGILLPLLHILYRDPDASLLVLPSDHYVRSEGVLARSLQSAVAEVDRGRDEILLLGFVPEEVDPELGYIVPDPANGERVRDVKQFIEKPSAATARALIEAGGLWNSFIFAARGQTLLRAFERRCPDVVTTMRGLVASPHPSREALLELYERLPAMDFSRDIVESCAAPLKVLTVPACGWSDLGTPRRVAQAIARDRAVLRQRATAVPHGIGILDLAALPQLQTG